MSNAKSSKLALHGGDPVRSADRPWPTWPIFGNDLRDRMAQVVDSGKWWYGEEVAAFEEAFANFQDAAHCVTCTSGTTALEVALQGLGVGPGDEVIVPPYTFVATAMAVARMGAVPIFVDVDDTWCLDPDLAEAAITARTKAIMPVHFGSSLADMDRLIAVARAHDLKIVEDACHSWGSKWNGKGTGALGDCGVFSFQISKNLTAAEGGAIVSDDEALAELCRSITHSGRSKDGEWFEHPVLGTNARLTEFQGAILNVQLGKMLAENAQRAANAARLDEAFAAIPGLTPQRALPAVTARTYHLYCMRFDDEAFGCTRDKFIEAAQAEAAGFRMSKGYAIPLHKQGFLEHVHTHDYSDCHFPVTEDLCDKSAVWFHHSLLLGDEADMADIVAIVQKIHELASSL